MPFDVIAKRLQSVSRSLSAIDDDHAITTTMRHENRRVLIRIATLISDLIGKWQVA